jgi:glycosyltransferase involved in cell wall biosynthesis
MDTPFSLSIVVPAYNEEANLASTVSALEDVLLQHSIGPLEWLLVDDGSVDGTYAEITALAGRLTGAVPLQHPANQGLGAAIWTGMTRASGEWCTWMPADGQIDPQSIVDMVQIADKADVILLMRDETERGRGRQLLTLGFYGWMRVMFGFDPYGFSGIYLARRQIVQGLPSYGATAVQNYAVAIYGKKHGYRIAQVHTVIRPRLSGRSKVANLPTMIKTLSEIFVLRFRS